MRTGTGWAWQNPAPQQAPAQASAPRVQASPISFGTRPGQGGINYRTGLENEPSLSVINDLLAEMAGRNLGFGISLAPQREQALYDLLQVLSPENQSAQARAQFGALLGAGQEAARANAAALGRAGYGMSAQLGAQLGARNQAVRQGNQNLLGLTSPQQKAQNLASILSAIQGQSQNPALAGYMQAYGAEMQKNQSEEKPSFLSQILGIGGQLAGAGVFK